MRNRAAVPVFAVLAALTAITSACASSYVVVHSFSGGDGGNPQASLINVGGVLYGTTLVGDYTNLGTVFSLNPTTGAETVVNYFLAKDGADPVASLINVGGKLFGTTYVGGAQSFGTVFSVNLKTGGLKAVYSFKTFNDGGMSTASLINVGGTLYGTTGYYGGTVFSVNPKTGSESTLHSFTGTGTDGYTPFAGLININGTLYGTTETGGTHSCCGVVFALNLKTGVETTVYSFAGGSDGANPYASLINLGGTLYGTTALGGASNMGTVFALNLKTGVETTVYSFAGGSDGANPVASLTNVQGTLFGTTEAGGASNMGTVFSVNPATGAETVLHSFAGGADGAKPYAGLINLGGTLYGTTAEGGGTNKLECEGSGCGVVFAVVP